MDIKNFIENYFNENDIFFLGFKSREENPKIQWWNKPYTIKTIDYKKLQQLNYYKKDIYMTLNHFKNSESGRFEHNVKSNNKLFFDIDYNGETIKNKIIKDLGDPNILLQTSKDKFQLIYILDENIDKDIVYSLTTYYETDKTFDTSRVFRLPFFINNKNDFKVSLLSFTKDIKQLAAIIDIMKDKNIPFITPQTTQKSKETKKVYKSINNEKFNPNNKFYSLYLKQLESCNNDYSRTDLKFVRTLRYKKIPFDTCISFLFQSRKNILEKHQHEIEYYISNIEKKCSDI